LLFVMCMQVHILCKEALSDSPSCKPALDTLVQFYCSLAAASSSLGDAAAAARAVEHGLAVIEKAAIAEPMRENYWRHRKVELRKLARA
jgi:hypothetical protein